MKDKQFQGSKKKARKRAFLERNTNKQNQWQNSLALDQELNKALDSNDFGKALQLLRRF